MKKTLTLSLAMALPLLLFSQHSFVNVFSEYNDDVLAYSVAAASDGGAIFAGVDKTTPSQRGDFFVAKTDSEGTLLSYHVIDGPEVITSVGIVAEAPGGGFLVGGKKSFGEIILVETDPNGNVVWNKSSYGEGNIIGAVPSPGGGYALGITRGGEASVLLVNYQGFKQDEIILGEGELIHLTLASDGNYMVGYDNPANGISLIKLDADGNEMWQNTSTGGLELYTFAELPSGEFIVCGGGSGNTQHSFTWISADGDLVDQVDPAFSINAVPGGLVPQPDGDLVLVTEDDILHLNGSGDFIGDYPHPASAGRILAAAPHPDGRMTMAGYAKNNDIGTDGFGFMFGTGQGVEWEITFDPEGDEYDECNEVGTSCLQDADGNFILVGYRACSPFSERNFYVHKFNTFGNTIWTLNLGTTGFDGICHSVVLLSDGGYLLAGERFGAETNLLIYKIDKDGNLLWERNDAYPNGIGGYYFHAEELPNGDIGILFRTSSVNASQYVRIDSDGAFLTSNFLSIGSFCGKMTATADGDFLIFGRGTSNSRGELSKIDADGNPIFTTLIDEEEMDFDAWWGYGVEETSDGGIFGVSTVETNGTDAVALVKLDEGGSVEWYKFFSPSSNEDPSYDYASLVKNPNGNFTIVATSADEPDEEDGRKIFMIKIDEQGEELWSTSIGSDIADEHIRYIAPTSDGGVLMTGSARNEDNTDTDFLLIKTLGDGTINPAFQVEFLGDMVLSPNPSNGLLRIRFEGDYMGEVHISVFNEKGQLVHFSQEAKNSSLLQTDYTLDRLPDGAYFVRLSANQQHIVRTWLKN